MFQVGNPEHLFLIKQSGIRQLIGIGHDDGRRLYGELRVKTEMIDGADLFTGLFTGAAFTAYAALQASFGLGNSFVSVQAHSRLHQNHGSGHAADVEARPGASGSAMTREFQGSRQHRGFQR